MFLNVTGWAARKARRAGRPEDDDARLAGDACATEGEGEE